MYDINFNSISDNILPRAHRYPRIKALLYSMVKPIQWLRDNLIGYWYNTGSVAAYFSPSILPMPLGTRVRFPNNSVWEVIYGSVDTDVYNPTLGQIFDSSGNQLWAFVQDDFVGLGERIEYNNQKIKFEYLLNIYFGRFDISDLIYIDNEETFSMLYIGEREVESNYIKLTSDYQSSGISSTDTDSDTTSFIVYVPTTIVAILGSEWINRVSGIVDRYNFVGLRYSVTSYTP